MNRLRTLLALPFLIALPAPASAQADSEIYVAELSFGTNGVEIGPAVNATNHPGYDNQPWFTADGRSIVYPRMDDGESDIYRYDLDTGAVTRLTNTPGNELSPSVVDSSGEFLTMAGGDGPQNRDLWRYSAAGEPIAPFMEPAVQVAYYGIAASGTLIAWLNDGNGTLVRIPAGGGTAVPFRDRVAPVPPQRIPGETALSIVEPDFTGQMWIKRLDPETLEPTPIVAAIGEAWHHAWTPDGWILMADGEAIFAVDPNGSVGWNEIARFPGVGSISRIVVSPSGNRVAFVATVQ